MFKKRTLFIVGAGASKEFRLPLGTDLASAIARKTDFKSRRYDDGSHTGDPYILNAFARREQNKVNEFIQAGYRIRDGVQLSHSIDDFLDIYASDPFVNRAGKMAIVRAVLEAEASSTLHFDMSNIYNKIKVSQFEDTWLVKFMRTLVRGVAKENASTVFDNVSFIVFNYDRCIEHLLFYGLQQVFSFSREQAADILSHLEIIHPYGQVADLRTSIDSKGVQYGGEGDPQLVDYYVLSDEIKTYTEKVDDDKELAPIHREVERAERMVFLGFGFHDQNLALIKPKAPIKRRDIYATAYGMSASDVNVVRSQLLDFFVGNERAMMDTGRIQIRNDLTCAALFDQYSKSLPA